MGLIRSKKELVLRFELNGQILQEISSKDIKTEITIGRSDSCTWIIPASDRSASGQHAKITSAKGGLIISDLQSRNGIFFQGSKIQERKLKLGDHIRIGDCLLVVEEPIETAEDKAEHPFHRLEQLNGVNKGNSYDLNKPIIKIGSSPDCDIVLNDALVSHFHASIECKTDNSCWIKDIGSRNGTNVNGTLLAQNLNEGGRMLRDGDIISIAYIELRYLDRFVTHVRAQLGLKIAVTIITLLVCIGGYYAYMAVSPSAKSHIEAARKAAADEDFDTARKYLVTAANARAAKAHNHERAELEQMIDNWESTIAKWEEIKGLYQSQRWISANKLLSPLLSQNMELWKWNDTNAAQAKNEAILAKRLTDAYIEARTMLESEEASLKKIEEATSMLATELENAGTTPQFLSPLMTEANDILAELTATSNDWRVTMLLLENFDTLDKLPGMQEKLTGIRETAQKRLAARKEQKNRFSPILLGVIDSAILPVTKLNKANAALELNAKSIAKLQFDKLATALPLPEVEECASHPNLADKRAQLQTLNGRLLNTAAQLKTMVETLDKRNLTPDKQPEAITQLLDNANLEKVLACDSFELKLPSRNRAKPSGTYDAILGIEIFYSFVAMLPDRFDTTILEDAPFRPAIYNARQDYIILNDFITFCNSPAVKNLMKNQDKSPLQNLAKHAEQALKRRDDFVKRLIEVSQKAEDRQAVIAGGMALLLSHNTNLIPESFTQSVVAKLKDVRKQTSDIAKKEVTPEQAIKNRRKILDVGIPGDSIVRLAWSEMYK
ncbi:MAG: FHA domain-containing protein [Lentisphaerae bacterium]|jgi:pSer/pThr/pTyr-binding forkhead associated (FHA) protein|nr:FHA domain-containing protein [Lentisphaerota bacterium]